MATQSHWKTNDQPKSDCKSIPIHRLHNCCSEFSFKENQCSINNTLTNDTAQAWQQQSIGHFCELWNQRRDKTNNLFAPTSKTALNRFGVFLLVEEDLFVMRARLLA